MTLTLQAYFIALLGAIWSAPWDVEAACPGARALQAEQRVDGNLFNPHSLPQKNRRLEITFDEHNDYYDAVQKVDWDAVKADIVSVIHTSEEFWPADWQDGGSAGNYGPFFIRQAWHCSGSYRTSDGRGGCSGTPLKYKIYHIIDIVLIYAILDSHIIQVVVRDSIQSYFGMIIQT